MMTAPTLQIKRLEERIKELEAALRPFAIAYEKMQRSGNHSFKLSTNQLHFRRAYKVYGKLAAERPEVK